MFLPAKKEERRNYGEARLIEPRAEADPLCVQLAGILFT
jgi:hypothetical protein